MTVLSKQQVEKARKRIEDGEKLRAIARIVAREMKILTPRSGGGTSTGSYDEEPPLPEPTIGDDLPFNG